MTSRRILPDAAAWAWQRRAACRGVPETMFFHPDLERGSARRARDAKAKAVCAGCPVILECRRHAIAAEEPYGVWGGQDEDERRQIIVRRRRQARRSIELGRMVQDV
ncbi:WhiB family transcriptional regulator [Kutzneria buriramensis]|uniref:Transcriptional regulator WhiB n=1 Tax=Kutzneria buriramensis TaxID=1045776 RepID=A0A3E0H7S1_9PSEU|nr:WhiB family transcriptional regulator [Kutzneria buriramensis]REH39327.1 WhiB family redox-sensing transcriptional regulator [Kutzneria buriramensis]